MGSCWCHSGLSSVRAALGLRWWANALPAFAEQPIKDAVITVPAYFNQAERRAVLHAAAMADLKVLQLINDNTAVALNYGVFRRKDINATAQVPVPGARGACRAAAAGR